MTDKGLGEHMANKREEPIGGNFEFRSVPSRYQGCEDARYYIWMEAEPAPGTKLGRRSYCPSIRTHQPKKGLRTL